MLDHGRTVAHGTPDELKTRIGTDRVEVTLASAQRARRRSPAPTASFASNEPVFDPELLVATVPVVEGTRLMDVMRALDAAGVDAVDLNRREASLDDVFLTLTGHKGDDARTRPGSSRGARMTTTTDAPITVDGLVRRSSTAPGAHSRSSLASWWSDSLVFAGRNIEHIRQIPEKLLDVTLQPLMFVLLFAFVFGGAITVTRRLVPRVRHRRCADPVAGVRAHRPRDCDRDRSHRRRHRPLPLVARRRAARTCRATTSPSSLGMAMSVVVLLVAGLIVGWGVHSDMVAFGGALALLFLFCSAMIWIGTWIGLTVRTPDAVMGVAFVVVFPLTFVSSAFVPINTLPTALQYFAAWNPVSVVINAIRELFGNPTVPTTRPQLAARPRGAGRVRRTAWCCSRSSCRHRSAATGPAPATESRPGVGVTSAGVRGGAGGDARTGTTRSRRRGAGASTRTGGTAACSARLGPA